MKTEINYNMINDLYMGWLNETDPFMQRKRLDDIKRRISPHDLLMYSIRYAMPFQAFKDIFSLKDLFKTLEEMEKRGEDITNITNKILIIQGVEDIQGLNDFAQKRTGSKVGNLRLKFQGSNLFSFGDVKKIGKKFPYACVNFIDIASIEQMLKEEKDYKGVPIIITIDNMGELPLDKLNNIERKFDVAGIRIIEKDRNVSIEQSPISLEGYKQIRTVVDNEIISKLYVTEYANKTAIDIQLATQIFCLIADKVKYDKEIKGKYKQMSLDEWFSYYSGVSNITGLVTGKTICGGYAEILRNVLSCVDIKSKTIVGKTASEGCHAWNQIELGNTWFNTDLTWAAEQIREEKSSGDLFMSDVAFFGDRREMIFDKGQHRSGTSMEIEATVGGHTNVFNTNSEKCESYLSPYLTAILIKRARQYEEDYKKYDKSSDYKGAVPYVGSSIEKMHSSSKNIETPAYSGH